MTEQQQSAVSLPAPLVGALFLAGPNACGKGTIAAQLLKDGIAQHHLSMGQLLRDLVQRASIHPDQQDEIANMLGSQNALSTIAHSLQQGLLIEDRWTQTLIELALQKHPELQHTCWILDGYPRRVAAARHLLGALQRLNLPIHRVIHLTLPEAEVLERSLHRRRADDTPEAVKRRYQLYLQEVVPTIEHLRTCLGASVVVDVSASAAGPAEVSKPQVYRKVLSEGLGFPSQYVQNITGTMEG